MAISDKYLPGNLNRDEMDTIKGIPMSVFDKLSQEDKERILGLGSEERTVKGIPISIFNTLSPEEQNQLLGNLNRAELNQLRGSKSGTGMSSEFERLIGQLIAAGVPREEILRIIQSRMDAMTGGVEDVVGDPMSRFNQGGIVSLRHLTRPIGI